MKKTTTPTTRINFRFHAPFISPSSCQLLLSFWKIWFILSGFFFIPPQFFPRLPSFPHSQWEKERMCMQNMQKITNAFWSMSGREIGIACMQIHRDREDDKLSWNIEKLLHILLHIISRCRRSCCSCCLWNMWKYWNYDDSSHNILRERERGKIALVVELWWRIESACIQNDLRFMMLLLILRFSLLTELL